MRLVRVLTEKRRGRLYVVEPVQVHPDVPLPTIRTQADFDAYVAAGGVYVRVACIGSSR